MLHCLYAVYYSVVDLKRYRKATSYSRSVQLLGYTVGSVLGQILVSFDLMSYSNIMLLTLILNSIALPVSLFLPMPQRSMFFHRRRPAEITTVEGTNWPGDRSVDVTQRKKSHEEVENKNVGKGENEEKGSVAEKLEESVGTKSCGQVLLYVWRDVRHCYSSRELIYWSVWWALATCGYNQTVNYVQVSYKPT